MRTPAKELAAKISDEDDTATSWLTPSTDKPRSFKEIVDSTSAELQNLYSPQLRVVVDTTSAMIQQDTGTCMSLNQRFKQASMSRKIEQQTDQHVTDDASETSTPMNKIQCHESVSSRPDSQGSLQDPQLVFPLNPHSYAILLQFIIIITTPCIISLPCKHYSPPPPPLPQSQPFLMYTLVYTSTIHGNVTPSSSI